MFGPAHWETTRDAKLAERAGALSVGDQLLGLEGKAVSVEADLEVLQATAPQIVAGIEAGKWTATSVLLAYVRSSLRVQEACNPLTEVMYGQAFKQAEAMDKEFARTGKLVGPLHGVPCSLKDQIGVEGVDTTLGFSHEYNRPEEEDSALVKVLKAAGAIPFVKTNVPQTMLAFECSNPLFGTTNNPYDATRTCGGSSGGEAALLASDGAPLGFGSDIGGSLRIPVHYSGCFGLKPCTGRFPDAGAKNPNPGFEGIKTTLGPMGRSVDDLELAMRVVVNASVGLARTLPLIPLAYREVVLPAKLKFGYYLTDGFCRASPACERAVLETVAAMRKLGHECVEFVPPNPSEALELFVALTSAGGYQTLLANLKGDPQESALWLVTLGVKLPWLVRSLATSLLTQVVGDEKMAAMISASHVKSITATQEWAHRRDLYVANFRKLVWGTLALDAIICAPQATPALRNGQTWDLSPLAIGTILYNVVDSTAGVLPVTFVDAVKDDLTDAWRARGTEPGSKLIEDHLYGKGGAYSSIEMAGLPVGVQIVGATWEEEKVIAIMRLVDDALGARGFGPGEFAKKTM